MLNKNFRIFQYLIFFIGVILESNICRIALKFSLRFSFIQSLAWIQILENKSLCWFIFW